MSELLELFLATGFAPHEHEGHFGCKIPYVDYLYKQDGDKHVYLSVVNYDNKPVEIVYEVYLTKKNTRIKGKNNIPKEGEYSEFQKKGFHPIEVKLLRGSELGLKKVFENYV